MLFLAVYSSRKKQKSFKHLVLRVMMVLIMVYGGTTNMSWFVSVTISNLMYVMVRQVGLLGCKMCFYRL